MDEHAARDGYALGALARSTARGSFDSTGYTSLVLDRLVRKACEVLGAEGAAIAVHDRSDPRALVVAAACGIDEDVIGRRIAADEGIIGRAIAGGEPLLLGPEATAAILGVGEDGSEPSSAAVAPIAWGGGVRGAVSATSSGSRMRLDGECLNRLCELAEQAAAALEHTEWREELTTTVQARVESLAAALELRSRHTVRHSDDVVELVGQVGEAFGLEPAALIELGFAARLHDVGKIRMPDAILNKRGPLDWRERAIMRRHPAWGADLLARTPGLEVVATIVRFHHERWDGRGYPSRLSGERIPLASRIVTACDAYSAMTATRPYRMGMSPEAAVEELRAGAGSQFDPAVVDALIGALDGGLLASLERAHVGAA